MPAICRTQGELLLEGWTASELLPEGWMASEDLKNKVSSFKYYLNDIKTLAKLKKHAVFPPMVENLTKDNSVSLQFSTGAYIKAVSPLVKFYKDGVGKGHISKVDVDGLDVSVSSVVTNTDAKGQITGYVIELSVEGKKVKLTPFDTTTLLLVQGGKMQEEYTKRALLPYIKVMIEKHASKLDEINIQFQQLGTVANTKNRNKPGPKSKTVIPVHIESDSESDTELDTSQTIPQGDQQLSDSVLILSTLHPPEYCSTPPSSPRRLALEVLPAGGMEDQDGNKLALEVLPAGGMDGQDGEMPARGLAIESLPAGGMDGQDVKLPAIGLDEASLTSTRMEANKNDKQTAPCAQPPAVYATNLNLRRSLPEHVIGKALSQYYNSRHILTTPTVVLPSPIDQIWTDFEEKKFRRKELFFG